MSEFANGRIPESRLVALGSGRDADGTWKHLAPPGTAARWNWLRATGRAKYGVTLRVTPGWNLFRPLDIQFLYRRRLGIMAAQPGFSSHGGVFRGRDCMAIDVQNWGDLAPGNSFTAWARFVALCRLAGFQVDFVKPRETWHIGDFDPWKVPAAAKDFRINSIRVRGQEESDMPIIIVQRADAKLAKGLFDTTTGKLRREISKSENNLYRAAQKTDPAAVIYATVSDKDYAVLRG
ncbi:hypothetical protein [Microbacterium sp. 2FI]|uniref:hypothetical protein n=1 Tax=Microbacterium sp. 2FI TaxID=2502193 RepID=UPI0010F65591|nr:hypothetical protein [Microbacterium sp. 2FI]